MTILRRLTLAAVVFVSFAGMTTPAAQAHPDGMAPHSYGSYYPGYGHHSGGWYGWSGAASGGRTNRVVYVYYRSCPDVPWRFVPFASYDAAQQAAQTYQNYGYQVFIR